MNYYQIINKYRFTHKGWDCKDDLKLMKYDDFNVKLSLLPWILSLIVYLLTWQRKKVKVAENPKYKKIDSLNYVQSSLKSNPS